MEGALAAVVAGLFPKKLNPGATVTGADPAAGVAAVADVEAVGALGCVPLAAAGFGPNEKLPRPGVAGLVPRKRQWC